MSTVLCFATLSGMEFIGKVLEVTDLEWKMENVLAFIMDGDNLRLTPPTAIAGNSEKGVTMNIQRSGVVFTYDPPEQIKNAFAEITGSVIAVSSMPFSLL